MGKIYLITNIKNNMQYVGQTKNYVSQRFAQHIDNAHRSNKEKKTSFYKDIVESGENVFNDFKFEILEECDNSLLNEKEKFWIKKIKPQYNFVNKKEIIIELYSNEICKLYKEEKYNINELMQLYSLKHYDISNILKNNNIKIMKARPKEENRKKVYHFDLYGNLINEYSYTGECSQILNMSRYNIRMCCINNTKKGYLLSTCFGEYFSYIKEQPYIYKIINIDTKEEILCKTKKAVEYELEKRLNKHTYFSQIRRKGRKTFYNYEVIDLI